MRYRLMSAYWDGETLHKQGAELDFPEGKAPAKSVPVPSQPAKATGGKKSAADADDD